MKKHRYHSKPILFTILITAVMIQLFYQPTSSARVDDPSATVQQNNQMTGDTSPEIRAQSYSYYKALQGCIRNEMQDTIYTAVGQNGETSPSQGQGHGPVSGSNGGEWFNGYNATVGVYPNGSDNRMKCSDLTKKAMTLWGYDSGKTFLTAMGYTYDDSLPAWVSKYNGDGDARVARFNEAIKSRIGDPASNSLYNATAQYVMYYSLFTSKPCNGKYIENPDSTQQQLAAKGASAGGLTYATIKQVNESDQPTDAVYTYVASQDTNYGDGSAIPTPPNPTVTYTWWMSRIAYTDTGHINCSSLPGKLDERAQALAAWNGNHEDDQVNPGDIKDGKNSSGEKDAPDCSPDMGLGWIICPTVNFLADVGDNAKNFIDDAMVVNTFEIFKTTDNNGAYNAWKTMRNIANVLFIVAFLFMIYSQITGFGMTNYALKKMLPRLIIAAILINASYYICVAGVEISNVVGQGLDRLISAGQCGPDSTSCIQVQPPDNSVGAAVSSNLAGLATAALAIGIATYFFLPMVFSVIIYVAFIAIAAATLLGIRQALIILLVIASPIAFAAYLLPNTEGIFKKWWGLFKTLLLLYPIFGLLYGAGKLAAHILGQPSLGWEMNIFGYVALFSGLLVLPKLLEGALAVGGISSIVSKFQGKATSAAQNKAKQAYDNSTFGNFRKYRQNKAAQRRMAIKAGQYKGSNKNPLNWTRNARSKFADATLPMYGSGYAADVQQRGAEAEDKLWEQKVGNQQKYMSLKSMGSDDLMKIVANEDGKSTAESRAAAAGMIMKNGSMKEIQNLFDETQPISEKDDAAIGGIRKQMMHDMNRTPFGLGSFDIANLRRGQAAIEEYGEKDPKTGKRPTRTKGLYSSSIAGRAESKLSDSAWAGMDPDDQQRLLAIANGTDKLADGETPSGVTLSDNAMRNLVNATYMAENNPNISVKDETRRWGEEIRAAAAKRGIFVTNRGGTGNATPAAPQAGGPHLRGGEDTTDSGIIVPHDRI